jgi:DNA-binding CsgD family transcriptional regulator
MIRAKIPVEAEEVQGRFMAFLECLAEAGQDPGQMPEALFSITVGQAQYTLVRPRIPDVPLSPKQKEILVLLSRGFSDKQIRSLLSISQGTLATHLGRIKRKFDVESRAEMIVRGPVSVL